MRSASTRFHSVSLSADAERATLTVLRHIEPTARVRTRNRAATTRRSMTKARAAVARSRRQSGGKLQAVQRSHALYWARHRLERCGEPSERRPRRCGVRLTRAVLTPRDADGVAMTRLMEVRRRTSWYGGQCVFDDACGRAHAKLSTVRTKRLAMTTSSRSSRTSTGLCEISNRRNRTQDDREVEQAFSGTPRTLFAALGEWREEFEAR